MSDAPTNVGQTLQVRVSNDTKKIQSSDWTKLHYCVITLDDFAPFVDHIGQYDKWLVDTSISIS